MHKKSSIRTMYKTQNALSIAYRTSMYSTRISVKPHSAPHSLPLASINLFLDLGVDSHFRVPPYLSLSELKHVQNQRDLSAIITSSGR